MMVCMAALTTGAYANWTFEKSFSPQTGESCRFIDVDGQGDVWVTDYGAPGTSQIIVYNADGTSSQTISQGQISGAPQPLSDPGGVACDTTEGVVYCVSYENKYIFKYNEVTNAAMDGIDLDGVIPNAPGDVDILISGSKTYIALVNKVSAQWGLLDPAILAPTSYIVLYGVPGWHLNRGIGVNDTTNAVYIADEDSDAVHVWNQTAPGAWSQGTDLDTTTDGNQSACEVDDAGYVYCSITETNEVKIYDDATVLVETISSNLTTPRGCGFGTGKLYVVESTSLAPAVQMFTEFTTISDWEMY